ncbi:hypothetical protein RJ639_036920 [Escallonia herrerae]|uniref:Uncharacterized protein n=1 Tax=Escallonia herrerae TaxID=1293975 RepID=A0AA88WRE5_9ASTE|nr:hypothetical protein RJ639_036920 [Escallonia herrerae]
MASSSLNGRPGAAVQPSLPPLPSYRGKEIPVIRSPTLQSFKPEVLRLNAVRILLGEISKVLVSEDHERNRDLRVNKIGIRVGKASRKKLATKAASATSGVKKPYRFRHGTAGDLKVSEEHRAADSQAALPEVRTRDRARLQDGPEVLELYHGGTVRGHQSMRDSCQEGHNHAQGYPASEEDPRCGGAQTSPYNRYGTDDIAKEQAMVSCSTAESEYQSVAYAVAESY